MITCVKPNAAIRAGWTLNFLAKSFSRGTRDRKDNPNKLAVIAKASGSVDHRLPFL